MANNNRIDTYEDQLKNQLYRNWVKAGLAPKFLKEGLETFVDNIIKDLQIFFLSDICNTLGVVNEKCTACTTANVLPCPTFGICNLRRKGAKCNYHVTNNTKLVYSKCPKNICDRLHEKIRLLHRFQPPSWKNTDAQQWCTNHWEIAKCFLSPTGYQIQASIQETDCTGVLNIAINCLQVQKYLDVYIDPHNDVLSKIIKTRNDVVHSATMALTEDELDEYIGLMITLLEDKKILVNDPNAQNAIVKLKQLKECTFCITTKDETEIRDEAVQAAKHREQHDYLGRKRELQLGLCSMYDTHFRRIPISPLLENITEDLDDVFVELFICDDLTHENQVKKGKLSHYRKRVTKLNEIFCKTVGSTICKHIYVIGDAGMGKTTWCLKLLNTWVSACNKVRQVSSVNSNLTVDESMMLDFDVVLFVALRHGLRDGNIRDMIRHQLFEEHPNLDISTSEVLDREPDRCLIVIDGLDEWGPPEDFNHHSLLQHSQLPGRKGLNGCPCLTTTRPWKLENLRLSDAQIDRAVRIEGIEDARRLAEKVIQTRLDDTSTPGSNIDERSFEHFQHSLSGLSFNRLSVWKELDFLQIPLILLFVVCIWLDQKSIASSWTSNFTLILECLIKKADANKSSGRPGRLCLIDDLKSLQKKWKQSKTSLPDCLQNGNVVKYSGLIIRLAKLAFENLICLNKEKTLVFNELTLSEFLSESGLEVAVKIGILSQSQVVGKTLTKESSISFLHKTIQEYFAAVFLCSEIPEKDAALHTFLSYCRDLDNVYSVENVILFVFGLSSGIASEVSKHMAKFDMQDTHDLYVYRRISVKCQQEFQASNHTNEICSLYGASISFSVEKKIKLELFKTNWYVVKNDETRSDTAQANKLEDVHNATKWLPNLIADILKPNPRKTTNAVTQLLCGNTVQSKDKIEINLSYFSEVNEILLRKLFFYKIKLSKHFTNILLVEASDCCIEIKGNTAVGPETIAMEEYKSGDKFCANTADSTIKRRMQTNVKFFKCKVCKLQIDELNDQKDVCFEKIEIERCESCDIDVAQSGHMMMQTNNNVMTIGQIIILNSLKSKFHCSDNCKIDMIKYINCRECKFEYKLNKLTTLGSKRYIHDNRRLYQTNTLLFDQCDSCELKIVFLDQISMINSMKNCFEKVQQLHMVEFKNCKFCNFSSNSDIIACYPALVIQLLVIDFNNGPHIVHIYIESVSNFTKVNNASSENCPSKQIEFDNISQIMHPINCFLSNQKGCHDMSQIIQPIHGIKELTIGNCADETFEVLTQLLNNLRFLEKVTLRHSLDINQRFQERMFIENDTEYQTLQETAVNVISQLDKLKHLELVGLSLESYEAMASVLLSTFRLETLKISNKNAFIPKSIIDSLRHQCKLKVLKIDFMNEICLAQITEMCMTLTKLDTLSIHIDPIHISGTVILSPQHMPKEDNKAQADSLTSKTRDMSTNGEGGVSKEFVRSTRHLSNLKHLKLHCLTTEGSKTLAESISSMTRLERLDMSSHRKSTHLMRNDVVLSTEFIHSTKQLTNLKVLKLIGLKREANEALADSLTYLTTLEILHISSVSFDCLSTYLVHTIKHLTNLKILLLNNLNREATEALADSLPKITMIETLDTSSRPGYALSNKFMSSIKHLTNLEHLRLTGLDRETGKALAYSLATNTRIKKLDISDSDISLSNELMFSIKHLTNLENLCFTGLDSETSKALAYSVYTLTRIQTLSISSLNSSLSIELMSSIKHLTNLQHLRLTCLDLDASEALADSLPTITRIQTLDISSLEGNRLSAKLMSSIKQLTNLEHLRLTYLDTEASKSLAHSLPFLIRIQTLDISSSDFSLSIKLMFTIKRLTNLEHLRLTYLDRAASGALSNSLPTLTRIQTLDISTSYDSSLPNTLMSSIKHLTNLQHLRLSGLGIKASEALAVNLRKLTRIELLEISSRQGNTLSDELMSSIKHLTNLEHLRLTCLDTKASEALADSLPTLMIIELLDISSRQGNTLSDKLMSSIKHLTNLQHLRLTDVDSETSKALADSLPTLKMIQILDISALEGYTLSHNCVQSTTHLTKLKQLRLAGLATDGMVLLIAGLPSMTQLEKLEISTNDLFIVNEAFFDSLPMTNGPLSVKIENLYELLDDRLKQYIISKSRFQIVASSPLHLTTKNHFNVDSK